LSVPVVVIEDNLVKTRKGCYIFSSGKQWIHPARKTNTPCSNARMPLGPIAHKEVKMRIRRYETVFMVPADLDEAKIQDILNRLDAVLERTSGVLVRREDWGVRKLAYEINRHTKGRYFLMDFVGEPKIILELERNIKMIESILRFLTVKKADEVDMEGIRKEQEEEKEKEEARKASALQRAEEAEKKAQEEAARKEAEAAARKEAEAAEKEAAAQEKAEAAEEEPAAQEEAEAVEEEPAPSEEAEAVEKEAAAQEETDGAPEQAPETEKQPEADATEPEEAPEDEQEKT